MSLTDELAFLDATAQAGLVRSGDVKATELVDAAVERIERTNPSLNAVIAPMFDHARATTPPPDGPFAGVPLLLKDLVATCAGTPMNGGTAFLHGFVPPFDSELVARLKRAGFVVVGKTNTPELGILPTTEPRLYGPTRNPWSPDRTTGGSSGGSAAAVASGMVPVAHANDGGGSIRIPASCCGVFGVKPTRARNPMGPTHGDMMSGLIVEHALSRSVRDSAAVLDATSGPGLGDPYWAPPPARLFAEEVGADPGRLRIAFSTLAPNGAPVHPDCVAAVHDAAKLCEDLGHEVTEATPRIDPEMFVRSFIALWAAGMAWSVEGIARMLQRAPSPDYFEPLTWALYQTGKGVSGPDYLLALQWLQMASREIAGFFVGYDVLLTPVCAEPPVPLGTFDSPDDQPLAGLERAQAFVPFTPVCNVTGQPAMSVPLYWNAEGLPIGSHFVGRFGDEATLFRLASQLEDARPWADRRPPIS